MCDALVELFGALKMDASAMEDTGRLGERWSRMGDAVGRSPIARWSVIAVPRLEPDELMIAALAPIALVVTRPSPRALGHGRAAQAIRPSRIERTERRIDEVVRGDGD